MTDQNSTEQQQQQQQQQCTIDPWTDDDFLGQPSGFQNTASIEFVHDRIPRFGHTSNITEFIFNIVSDGEESTSQTHSYLTGVVACCVAFAAITTFWILVLLICRFTLRGSSRSGSWLSGRFRPLPPRPRPKVPQNRTSETDGIEGLQDDDENNRENSSDANADAPPEEPPEQKPEQHRNDECRKVDDDEDEDENDDDENDDGGGGQHKQKEECDVIIDAGPDGKEEDDPGPDDDEDDDPAVVLWDKQYRKVTIMRQCFRVICWFCSLAVILGTIMMIIQGVDYMESALSNLVTSLNLGQDLALQAANVSGEAAWALGRLQNDTTALLLSLNGICPSVRQRVCSLSVKDSTNSSSSSSSRCKAVADSNLTLLTLYEEWRKDEAAGSQEFSDPFENLQNSTLLDDDFDLTSASSKVVDAAIGTACNLPKLEQYMECNTTGIFTSDEVGVEMAERVNKMSLIQYDLLSFSEDVLTAYDNMEDAKSTLRTFDWALSVALAFMILSAVIGLFLFSVLTFPRLESFKIVARIQKCWVHPLFLLSAFLSLIFTCVFLIGSMAVSDFCIDGPEDNLRAVVSELGKDTQSIFFPDKTTWEFVQFYISKCQTPLPTLEILTEFVNENDVYMLRFHDELVGLSSKISEACGTEDSGALFLAVTTTTVLDYLCGITNLVRDFRELVRCKNIYPLYEQAMHQTVCFAGSDAFWWMAATNFVVVAVSLLLMTFRAAFFPIEIKDDGSQPQDVADAKSIEIESVSIGIKDDGSKPQDDADAKSIEIEA